MSIRLRKKKSSEEVRNEIKLINLENERLSLLKNSLIAEKVAKSELSVTEFKPIVSLHSLNDFQEKISGNNTETIEDINILLKGVKWDSLAYKTRSKWLVALVSNFKNAIEAKHFPKFEEIIVENILHSIKSSTVFLSPHITQNDLIIGEIYLENLEELNRKIDSKSIKIEQKSQVVKSYENTMDFEKEIQIFFDNKFGDKLNLSLDEVFGSNESLVSKLNLAVKLSHLSFINKIAFNKDKNTFENMLIGEKK